MSVRPLCCCGGNNACAQWDAFFPLPYVGATFIDFNEFPPEPWRLSSNGVNPDYYWSGSSLYVGYVELGLAQVGHGLFANLDPRQGFAAEFNVRHNNSFAGQARRLECSLISAPTAFLEYFGSSSIEFQFIFQNTSPFEIDEVRYVAKYDQGADAVVQSGTLTSPIPAWQGLVRMEWQPVNGFIYYRIRVNGALILQGLSVKPWLSTFCRTSAFVIGREAIAPNPVLDQMEWQDFRISYLGGALT